jgi:hypothetical protein
VRGPRLVEVTRLLNYVCWCFGYFVGWMERVKLVQVKDRIELNWKILEKFLDLNTVDSRYKHLPIISTGFFDPNCKKTFKFITQYKHRFFCPQAWCL